MARKPKAPASDSPPAPEKPKVIQIVSVYRGRRNVIIHWLQGDAKHSLDERDQPLPEFYAAFEALPTVAATICHLGAKYAAKGLRIVKMDCGEKGGAPTVTLHARKDIDDAMKEFCLQDAGTIAGASDDRGEIHRTARGGRRGARGKNSSSRRSSIFGKPCPRSDRFRGRQGRRRRGRRHRRRTAARQNRGRIIP